MAFLVGFRDETDAAVVDPIELLKSQHREVEALFAEIEGATEDAMKSRAELFAELAHKIECHAQIEERLFYPEGKEADKDQTLEAYVEHDVVRTLIDKITATDSEDESFMAKVTVLKEQIEHHVREEEADYFPKVRERLGDERLRVLGGKMKAMFDQLDKSVGVKQPAKKAAASRRVSGKRPAAAGARRPVTKARKGATPKKSPKTAGGRKLKSKAKGRKA